LGGGHETVVALGWTAGCNTRMTGQAQPPSPTQKSHLQTPAPAPACPPRIRTQQCCSYWQLKVVVNRLENGDVSHILPSFAAAYTQGYNATAPPAGVRPARRTRTQAKLRQQAAPGHKPALRPRAAAGRARQRRAAASAAPPRRRRARRRLRPRTRPSTSPPPPARGARPPCQHARAHRRRRLRCRACASARSISSGGLAGGDGHRQLSGRDVAAARATQQRACSAASRCARQTRSVRLEPPAWPQDKRRGAVRLRPPVQPHPA